MDFRQYDNALGRFYSMDALSEPAYDQTPYHFGFNNPVFWSDPTGLFAQYFQAVTFALSLDGNSTITYNGGLGGWVVTVEGGEFDGASFYDYEATGTIMDEMIIPAGRGGGGVITPSWKDKFSADITNAYSSSGLRYGMEWFFHYDFAGGVGGYIINGTGGYNLGGRKDIKRDHKSIESSDMGNIGAGGAATQTRTALNLLQYLNSSFSLFKNDNNKIIRENNDTIWYDANLRSGFRTKAYKLKSK